MRTSHMVKNFLVLALGLVLGSCIYISMDKATEDGLTRAKIRPFTDVLRDVQASSIHRKPASHGGISQSGIPRMIHQTWHADDLPPQLQQWTRSWRLKHLNWDYFYWTRKGGKKLIETKFPRLMKTYDKYPSDIHRVNVHKYAMMYMRGGLFVDADIENMRRVDRLMDSFPCILSLEPPEHHVLLRERNQSETVVVNSIMACKPRHKFFEIVLNLLPQYVSYAESDDGTLKSVSLSTGSMFLSDALEFYNEVYKDAPNGERIHLLPSSWLMPTYDSVFENYFWKKCTTQYLNLPWDQRKSCVHLVKRNFENTPMNYSFTHPHWSRTEIDDLLRLRNLMLLNGFEGDIPHITAKAPLIAVKPTEKNIGNQQNVDLKLTNPLKEETGVLEPVRTQMEDPIRGMMQVQDPIRGVMEIPKAHSKPKLWRNVFGLKLNKTLEGKQRELPKNQFLL